MVDKMDALDGKPVQELVKELERLRKEVEELRLFKELAYRDSLTGLRNRRYLMKRLHEEIHRVQREEDSLFSIMMIDVNELKAVNDSYGHAEGDNVLRWTAEFLVAQMRCHDVACRTGGDEMILILSGTGVEGCHQLSARIRENLKEENLEREVPVNLSIGTATWRSGVGTLQALLDEADRAMYADKVRCRQVNNSVGRSA